MLLCNCLSVSTMHICVLGPNFLSNGHGPGLLSTALHFNQTSMESWKQNCHQIRWAWDVEVLWPKYKMCVCAVIPFFLTLVWRLLTLCWNFGVGFRGRRAEWCKRNRAEGLRGRTQNFALKTSQKTRHFALSVSHLPRAFVATWFELEQKLIQILVALLFMNFRAPKVVKWATVLPTAANRLSVDPFKRGTKR